MRGEVDAIYLTGTAVMDSLSTSCWDTLYYVKHITYKPVGW